MSTSDAAHPICNYETCFSLLFLCKDAGTPVSVTWQDHDICPSTSGGSNPVVAFDGDAMQVEGHNYASGAPEFVPDGVLPPTFRY